MSRPATRSRSGRLAASALISLVLILGSAPRASARQGFSLPPPLHAGSVRGWVVDAATRVPVPGAAVRVLGTFRFAVTDEDGTFMIEHVPAGVHNLAVDCSGFQPTTLADVVVYHERTAQVVVELYAAAFPSNALDTDAGYFRRNLREPTSRFEFSAEMIRRAPAVGTDVSRTLAMLPAMAQLGDVRNDLLVRGGSSMENAFYIDDIPVYSINHFPVEGQTGGSMGFLNANFIRDVRASVGGFSAVYGDRLSSVVDIRFREGDRGAFNGDVRLGVSGVTAGFEGPIAAGRGSWMASLTRSYLDLIGESVGTQVAPRLGDVQGKVVLDAGRDHSLTFLALASESKLEIGPDDLSGGVNLQDEDFGSYSSLQATAGFNWRALWSDRLHSSTSIAASRIAGRDELYDAADESLANRSDNVDMTLTVRSVSSYVVRRARVDAGAEATFDQARFDYFLAGQSAGPYDRRSLPLAVAEQFDAVRAAAFLSATIRPMPRLTATAGVRADHFSVNAETVVAPRLSASFEVAAPLTLTAAAGQFTQALPLFLISQDPANRSLPLTRAWHTILGAELLLMPGLQLTIEAYRKEYENFPLSPVHPERFPVDDFLAGFGMRHGELVPGGRALAEGIELVLQRVRVGQFDALASATYFRSSYQGLDGVWRDRLYDNRINAQAMIGYQPTPEWDFSARWSFGGGAPYTPVDVAYSRASGRTVFDYTRTNGERLPPYHSLNVRLERWRHFRRSTLVTYIAVSNAYSRRNVRMFRWDPTRDSVQPVLNLGLVPSVGLEFRF